METTPLHFPQKSDLEMKIDFLVDLLKLTDPRRKIHLKELSGGITNSVYRLDTPTRKYIVRVFGNNTEEIIDRKHEEENLMTIKFIDIFAKFGNGIVVSYIEGRSIDVLMMNDPFISSKIAEVVAKFHKVTYPLKKRESQSRENEIFKGIQKFMKGLDPNYVDPVSGHKIDLRSINDRYLALRKEIDEEMKDATICLCHNDLLSANILFDGESTVNLCDYEYSSYTWPEFDIANHFFEYCGFECDLSLFPTKEQQRRFVVLYLTVLFDGVYDSGFFESEKGNRMIEKWLCRINLLVKLSCFFWGTWGFFQAIHSEVNFPYFKYAETRIMLMDYSLPLPPSSPLLEKPLLSLT